MINSPRVVISHNTIADNGSTQIILQQHQRTKPPSPYGPHETRRVKVTDNEIWLQGAQTVGARDTDKPRQTDVFTHWHNSFARNLYHLDSRAR